jgi:pilus assembly protein Flp/PilA
MLLSLYARMQTAWFGMTQRVRDERGAVATEYALLLFFIAIAIIATVTALGLAIKAKFTDSCNALGGSGC